MKHLLYLSFLFVVSTAAQEKGDNAIQVSPVNFKQAVNALLDAGFAIEKLDSNFQIVKTEFVEGKGKNKWMKLRLFIRVKDSTAIITGEWVNSMLLGNKFLGKEYTIENSTDKIVYSFGNPKACFNEMKQFALTLGTPTYLKQ